jgi:hypothetical protein
MKHPRLYEFKFKEPVLKLEVQNYIFDADDGSARWGELQIRLQLPAYLRPNGMR